MLVKRGEQTVNPKHSTKSPAKEDHNTPPQKMKTEVFEQPDSSTTKHVTKHVTKPVTEHVTEKHRRNREEDKLSNKKGSPELSLQEKVLILVLLLLLVVVTSLSITWSWKKAQTSLQTNPERGPDDSDNINNLSASSTLSNSVFEVVELRELHIEESEESAVNEGGGI